jgi:Mg2+ and Co2+ transporter CorA
MWKNRTATINSAVLNHLSILESSKFLDEARNSRLLAVLGTIFLPLSLTSSILSMGGDFLPGNRKLWVYFAVSLPLLVLGLVFSFGTAVVAEKARDVGTRFKEKSFLYGSREIW